MEIYPDFIFVQISFIFNQGGLGFPFTLFLLSILTTQIFLVDGAMQFLLAQILNNWCAISSLAIVCDDTDALGKQYLNSEQNLPLIQLLHCIRTCTLTTLDFAFI